MWRAAVCLALALPAMADAACRQALALGLDVSGSVDSREYRLQLDGLAAALLHPEVQEILLSMPQATVRVAVFEWSGPANQRVLSPWTDLENAPALLGLAHSLTTTQRSQGDPSTAIGTALTTGYALLADQQDCWKRTLDISGDGKSNTGPLPRDITAPPGLTVNGLVIGEDDGPRSARSGARENTVGELAAYYRANVISGPEAFVETAIGFADYERAMVRKLKRELQGLALSRR